MPIITIDAPLIGIAEEGRIPGSACAPGQRKATTAALKSRPPNDNARQSHLHGQ